MIVPFLCLKAGHYVSLVSAYAMAYTVTMAHGKTLNRQGTVQKMFVRNETVGMGIFMC